MLQRKKVHRFQSKILDVKVLNSSVKHLTISTPEEFDFYPGQFVSFILEIDGREIRRPYSIASKPTPNSIEICIKILPNGLATPTIGKLKTGDELTVLGPMGAFTIKDLLKPLVFISTGTGIGPFRSMIHHLLEDNSKNKENKIKLIVGYRYDEDVLYEDEFKELEEKHPNFSYHRILSQSQKEKDDNGYVQSLVEKNLDEKANYYICGLKEMVNSVKDLLDEKGVPEEQVFFEKYD